MKSTDFSARVLYAVAAVLFGAAIGFYGMLRLLIRFGTVFQDNHPSMQGFGYFMMSIASGFVSAIVFTMIALTLPWIRPFKRKGVVARSIASLAFAIFLFLLLEGQGHALAFVLAMELWLIVGALLPFIRCGVIDAPLMQN